MSPILFLIYLQPLFQHLESTYPGHFYSTYVDDVGILGIGKTEANARLRETIGRTISTWSKQNDMSFDGSKTELVHFKERRKAPNKGEDFSVTYESNTIQPSQVIRWLGVWLD